MFSQFFCTNSTFPKPYTKPEDHLKALKTWQTNIKTVSDVLVSDGQEGTNTFRVHKSTRRCSGPLLRNLWSPGGWWPQKSIAKCHMFLNQNKHGQRLAACIHWSRLEQNWSNWPRLELTKMIFIISDTDVGPNLKRPLYLLTRTASVYTDGLKETS